MIYVTVGFSEYPFTRLIKVMDSICHGLNDKVIMQIGTTAYVPENCKFIHKVDEELQTKHMREARVIVAHAGAGTILTARELGKPMIIMPRRHDLGEHVDDHQLELCEELAKLDWIRIVHNKEELESAIRNHRVKPKHKDGGKIIAQDIIHFLKK